MTKKNMKIMLRAFNGESDTAIAKVKWDNITVMENRITKAFESINKIGSTNQISITDEYLDLKLQELRLGHELQEKIKEERDEQRRIQEQIREEEKAQRELDRAKEEAEREEERSERALEKARAELEQATGAKHAALEDKVKALEQALTDAQAQKQRAISQAQLTKSGYVYIISNVGSFGEHIYKIGMTRRLEPLDRVKELGDASVPFAFDVHAMIWSDDAPELEYMLHCQFATQRVNLVNDRKEFFRVSIDEIEGLAKRNKQDLKLTKAAEAREYRETLA
ncbi:MAG: DUF4041 domain-containing protein, partial [Planctomycetes bacterium]|nr:DUF4041 domain-containing protein [Planctomycetota bacterium]